MAILLLRHAKAGDRQGWSGDDSLRPLSKPGRRQAELLVESMKAFRIEHIVSSPSVRCAQTVEPLAAARGLAIVTNEALSEGAGARDALVLIRQLEDDAVLCTHGDVLWLVLHALTATPQDTPKGGGWVLQVGDSGPRLIRPLPPPTD